MCLSPEMLSVKATAACINATFAASDVPVAHYSKHSTCASISVLSNSFMDCFWHFIAFGMFEPYTVQEINIQYAYEGVGAHACCSVVSLPISM